MSSKKNKYFFILILIIVTLLSCLSEETKKLIDTSVTSGNYISEYYDNLILFTIQTWELEAFNSSLRGIEFPKDLQDEYQKTIDHLKARKALARSFTKVFPVLENLATGKQDEEFKEVLINLGNNIGELKPLKDNNIAIPSDIFGNLGSDVIELYKFFEIRYISKTLVKTLEKIKELFEKEKELYSSIIQDRNNKSQIVVNYMIDNELVLAWSLIKSAPATVDLEIAVARKAAKDEKTKEALKAVLEVKYYRMQYLTDSTQDEIINLLSELISAYNDFTNGKKVFFGNIGYLSDRLGYYFKAVYEYVDVVRNKDNNNSNPQQPAIIYHGNSETRVFHQPNCQYYNSKNCDVIFYSREEAIKEGYSPCDVCSP